MGGDQSGLSTEWPGSDHGERQDFPSTGTRGVLPALYRRSIASSLHGSGLSELDPFFCIKAMNKVSPFCLLLAACLVIQVAERGVSFKDFTFRIFGLGTGG